MKNTNTIGKFILFFAALLIFNACQKGKPSTILSGRNPYLKNDSVVMVKVDDYFPSIGYSNPQVITSVDSTGYFIFKSDRVVPGFYQVLRNNYPMLEYDIYLEPGDSIYLESPNWSKHTDIKISGKGAKKLNYILKDFETLYSHDDSYRDTMRSKGFETEMAFKSYIDSMKNIRIQALEANKTTPDNIKSQFLNSIDAELAKKLLWHIRYRNYFMYDSFTYCYPDSNYYSLIKDINFDSLFCKTSQAKRLAQPFLYDKVRTIFKHKKDEEWTVKSLLWRFNYILEQPKSIWTDYMALGTIGEFSFGMLYSGNFFENLLDFNKKMDTLFSSNSNKILFQKGIADYLKLAQGNPAPDFALPDPKGNIVRLSDFKGKIVYIDFWGTWCYPCIQEIPNSIKLQKKYKGKPVVFLYVALESDEKNIAEWKQFILGKNKRFGHFLDNKPFPGIHLVAERQFLNPEIKPYKLNFTPNYVLIDPKGNIVNTRAERPDSIPKEIDKLLEEMN